jgi:hypothetical protein
MGVWVRLPFSALPAPHHSIDFQAGSLYTRCGAGFYKTTLWMVIMNIFALSNDVYDCAVWTKREIPYWFNFIN